MASTSPPKPWEIASSSTSDNPPSIPDRPSSLNNRQNQYQQSSSSYGNNNAYNSGGYGSSTYGMGGGYGSSSYGMGGGYGSNSYGMGGGYGSSYGMNSAYSSPYGSSSYGIGGYGSGAMSPYGMNRGYNRNPYDTNSQEMPLGAQVEQSTQHAFFVLDQIVQAFSGFSHMLESTFHATHSSFMAMVGVAEQFGNLRSYLGQVLSLMHIYKVIKGFFYKLSGRRAPIGDLNTSTFDSFSKALDSPKKSARPLWFFLSLLIGLPYLVSILLRRIQASKPNTVSLPPPKDVTFCRALYDFTPTNPDDLPLKKGQIVAILSKLTESGDGNGDAKWWRGRTQDGRIGVFPGSYVEVLEKKAPAALVSGNVSIGDHSRVSEKGAIESMLGIGKDAKKLDAKVNDYQPY